MVDNTFATPVLQRPLELGADLVMHSLTKALGGHSDIIGGALVGSQERIDRARDLLKVLGGCLDPHAASLALRGLKTLHLRVERQCENALALARHLESHPKVARVLYPGLESHPRHEVARRQMSAFGGMVAFVLPGGLPAAERFYDGLRPHRPRGQPGRRGDPGQPARAHLPPRVHGRTAPRGGRRPRHGARVAGRGGRGRPHRGRGAARWSRFDATRRSSASS